jgi:hypothetical protein
MDGLPASETGCQDITDLIVRMHPEVEVSVLFQITVRVFAT